jgi:hypothetical protein
MYELTNYDDDNWLVINPEIAEELGFIYDPALDRILRGGFWNSYLDNEERWDQFSLAPEIPERVGGLRPYWRAR